MFENVFRGTEIIGGKIISYRSGWERNWAIYLQWQKEKGMIKDWEYEPQRFYFIDNTTNPPRALGNGYLPDFKVIKLNGTVYYEELKGYKQGKMKLKRMKKYHPTVEINLIEAKEYLETKKKIGKMLQWI
jgi:hypothetical protein